MTRCETDASGVPAGKAASSAMKRSSRSPSSTCRVSAMHAYGARAERVVIARPDRLSRSHMDIRTILHVLEEWGMQCESLEQPGYLQALRPAESE